MIPKFMIIVFLLFPATCIADTYLCVGEAGAIVEHGGLEAAKARVLDVSTARFVISNVSGSWQFREIGEDYSALVCLSEYWCEVEGGFGSIFFREKDSNLFTYIKSVAFEPDFKRKAIRTVKGMCSKL